MTGGFNRAVGLLGGLVTLPPTVAHELAHVLVVLPWVDRLGVIYDPPTGHAEVRVNYADGVPRWAKIAAHYAPFGLGLLLAGLALAWVVTSGSTPERLQEWLLWSVVGVWWVIFTLPSADDREVDG